MNPTATLRVLDRISKSYGISDNYLLPIIAAGVVLDARNGIDSVPVAFEDPELMDLLHGNFEDGFHNMTFDQLREHFKNALVAA